MIPMRAACTIAIAAWTSGCFLDRSLADLHDASIEVDAFRTVDAGTPRDAGIDAGCAPGTFDVDLDPANGCECTREDPALELCDGRDNDCDRSTADGSGEPRVACDGADSDACRDGFLACDAGSLACTDPLEDSFEVCGNGIDDDCSGAIDDASAIDARRFFDDDDGDGHGDPLDAVSACTMPAGYVESSGDCDDTTPSVSPAIAESCNGRDDNCSGVRDDDGSCPCATRHRDGRPYLFCTSGQTFRGARDYCVSFGYRLTTVDDSDENTWISSEARAISGSRYWIGASQNADGDWVTVTGAAIPFSAWHDDQPDDGDIFTSEDCVELHRWSDATWNDVRCDASNAFVCEYPD